MSHSNWSTSVVPRICWGIVSMASLSTAIALAVHGRSMAPVQPGTAQAFWQVACGVGPYGEVGDDWTGRAYFVNDDWVGYEVWHLHGSNTYYISKAEVLASFSEIVAAFEQAETAGINNAFVRGYSYWKGNSENPSDAGKLVDEIRKAQ